MDKTDVKYAKIAVKNKKTNVIFCFDDPSITNHLQLLVKLMANGTFVSQVFETYTKEDLQHFKLVPGFHRDEDTDAESIDSTEPRDILNHSRHNEMLDRLNVLLRDEIDTTLKRTHDLSEIGESWTDFIKFQRKKQLEFDDKIKNFQRKKQAELDDTFDDSIEIDLSRFRCIGEKEGKEARRWLGLDIYDQSPSRKLIVTCQPGPDGNVPKTFMMTSTFALGLFGDSIRKCGSGDKFKEKFDFSQLPEHQMVTIDHVIRRALEDHQPPKSGNTIWTRLRNFLHNNKANDTQACYDKIKESYSKYLIVKQYTDDWSDEFIATSPLFPGLSAFGDTEDAAFTEGMIVLGLMFECLYEDSQS